MRTHSVLRLFALAALCTAAAGCFDTESQTCKSGLVCPGGSVCAAVEDVCLRAYPGTDAACGDGSRNHDSEACDDGNIANGDGCSNDCKSKEVCGNGIVDVAKGEVCDDGNTVDGDRCAGDCKSNEVCGNGVVDRQIGEVCDDGNFTNGDGCSRDCLSTEFCGNGYLDAVKGEACDDGNTLSGDNCSADCRSLEVCGNGFLDNTAPKNEVCDDGNLGDGDGCSANCRSTEVCGNGIRDTAVGEVCDDGNVLSGDACSADCKSGEGCGNGIVDPVKGEECDDGNSFPDDDCTNLCKINFCGDGIVDTASPRIEACDHGNGVGGESATCNSNCTIRECGDNIVNPSAGETCDTGAGPTCDNDPLSANPDCDTPACDGRLANSGNVCSTALCGDGYPNAARGEECDTAGESPTCDSNCTLARCGDSFLNQSAAEECDKGDADSATCDGSGAGAEKCTIALCGDGYANPARNEQCDTVTESSSCDGDCTFVVCGDGRLNTAALEACDNLGGADTAACDGSSAPVGQKCTAASCGDGYVNAQANESCDTAGGADSASCDGSSAGSQKCTGASCGDGYTNAAAGEACDNLGGSDTAACVGSSAPAANRCTASSCGDAYVNAAAGETCDVSGGADTAACDGAGALGEKCTAATCGDLYVNTAALEQCEDGNTADDDDCVGVCQTNVCGDGFLDTLAPLIEVCDDNNTDTELLCPYGSTASCSSCAFDCQSQSTLPPRFCGDGNVDGQTDANEVCDDRNADACGTCSSDCKGNQLAVAATGTIDAPDGGVNDGRIFTLDDGVNTARTFEFDKGTTFDPSRVRIQYSGGDSASTMATRLVNAITNEKNAGRLMISAQLDPGDNTRLLLAHTAKTRLGNQAITFNANGGFAASGMSGGVAGDCNAGVACNVDDDCGPTLACDTVTRVCRAPLSMPTVTGTTPASPANNNSPTVDGTAFANAQVTIFTDAACTPANQAGAGTASAGGSFAITVSVADGSNTTFWAIASDGVGFSKCSTTSANYIEDSIAPVQPAITSTNPASPANNRIPLAIGTAEANSAVQIFTGSCTGSVVGTGAADGAGAFSIQLNLPTNDLTYQLFALARDAANNPSPCSAAFEYIEDSTANAPVITGFTPASPANNNNPTVNGTAEIGATVQIYDGTSCGSLISGASAIATDGTFAIPVSVGDNSATDFTARLVDQASNVSACSNTRRYTEDSQAPAMPSVNATTTPASGGNANTFTITGSSDSQTFVHIYADDPVCGQANEVAISPSTGAGSTFSVSVTVLDDTDTRFYAAAFDAAGNKSLCSATSVRYVEDSTPPAVPTVTGTNPATTASTPSTNNTPQVTGTGTPGSTVTIFSNPGCTTPVAGLGSGTAAAVSGNFTITLTTALPSNAVSTLYANARDAANNVSACSATFATYHEDSAMAAPVITGTTPVSPGNTRVPTVSGTAEANATVRIYDATGCAGADLVGTGTADGTGAFSFALTTNLTANAASSLFANGTDVATNTSTCSTVGFPYTHDGAAPARPAGLTVTPVSGSNDSTPTISGTAEAGSTVQLYTDSACTPANAVAGGSGTATGGNFAITVTVANGSTTEFWANATDAANNTSVCSTSSVVYTDDVAPGAIGPVTQMPQ